MSRIKGKWLLTGGITDLAMAAVFYGAFLGLEHLAPMVPEIWAEAVALGVLLCFVSGAGRLCGFAAWNLGMLVHRLDMRRFERLEARIEAEVDVRIEKERLREAKKSLRELADGVREWNRWMQAATPTMAMRMPEHQDWHGRSFGDHGGWQVWPCDCPACGPGSRVTLHGGPVIRCGIEFVLKQDGRHAYASVFSNHALRISDHMSLAPWVSHRIDLGVVPEGILIPENVTEAEAEQFKRDLHAFLERS